MEDRTRRLVEYVRESIIGEDLVFVGPFGPRRLVYSDYTASGRCLSFVEDFIREQPVKSVLIAAGTGALLGWLLRRR